MSSQVTKQAHVLWGFSLINWVRTVLCALVMAGQCAYGVSVDSYVESVNLAHHIYWLEDNSHELSFEQVQKLPLSHFSRNTSSRFNRGYSQSTYWLRIDVDFDDAAELSWLLDVAYPLLDYVTFYEPTETGRYRIRLTGDRHHYALRELDVNTFLFSLKPQTNTQHYYLQIKSQDSIQVPIILWQEKYYPGAYAEKMMWHGIYLGAMLIMILYNTFIFFTTRNESYLFYILSVTSIALFLMGSHGLNYQFLWPESIWWANISIPFFGGLFSAFGAMFVRSILRTERFMPEVDKYLKLFILGLCISVPLILILPYSLGVRLGIFNALAFSLVSFVTVLYGALKGGRTAKILLLAWSICIVLLFIAILGNLGVVQLSGHGPYLLQYTSFIEAAIFSFTLADKINQLNNDKKELTKLSVDALAEGNQYLLDSIKLKDEFIATITHEIRTPMNAILGSSLLLQDSTLDKNQNKYVGIIEKSGGSLLKIINDVLDYSKLESKKLEIKEKTFSIESSVLEVVNDISDRYRDKNVPIYVYISSSLPEKILSDETRLKQILFNLLDNAFKFTDTGHISLKVVVKQKDNDHYIQFKIVDTGIGIEGGHMGSLYEGFTQADNSISRRHGGTGLGLAISHRLCNLMRGRLEIDSVCGQGTQVNFEIQFTPSEELSKPKIDVATQLLSVGLALPVVTQSLMLELLQDLPVEVTNIENNNDLINTKAAVVLTEPSILKEYSGYDEKKIVLLSTSNTVTDKLTVFLSPYTQKSMMGLLTSIQQSSNVKPFSALNNTDFSSLRVLAVDDDATNRMIISSVLRRYKIKADIAESGNQALEMASQVYGQYDLILMDLEMPDMDGYEATRRLRSYEREHLLSPTQIVALSAHSIEEFKGLAIASGMNDFMNKPIKKQSLEILLNKVLMDKIS